MTMLRTGAGGAAAGGGGVPAGLRQRLALVRLAPLPAFSFVNIACIMQQSRAGAGCRTSSPPSCRGSGTGRRATGGASCRSGGTGCPASPTGATGRTAGGWGRPGTRASWTSPAPRTATASSAGMWCACRILYRIPVRSFQDVSFFTLRGLCRSLEELVDQVVLLALWFYQELQRSEGGFTDHLEVHTGHGGHGGQPGSGRAGLHRITEIENLARQQESNNQFFITFFAQQLNKSS